jgi:glycosyltransferase involved in cell wall biosynthesis
MSTHTNDILFSVLILSIPSRIEKHLNSLYNKLSKQTDDFKDVEVLCLIDNKRMSIGEKRQNLLNCSRGKWVGFMDDDDDVSDDYIASLHQAMKNTPADVITFDQNCTVNGMNFVVSFSMKNPNERYVPGMTFVRRPPFHICFWKREITQQAKFENSSYGEDYAWCVQMYPHVKSETHIDKHLHHYRYDDRTSESIMYFKNDNK